MKSSVRRREVGAALFGLNQAALCIGLMVACLARPAVADPLGPRVDFAWEFAGQRLDDAVAMLQTVHPTNFNSRHPFQTDPATGDWVTNAQTYWTSGFFAGTLWQMYDHSGEAVWLDRAVAWTATIEPQKNYPSFHDIGFQIINSFGNGWRLHPDPAYRQYAAGVLLTAANTLNARFNKGGIPVGAIRTHDFEAGWGKYPTLIDSMMNIELMFMAYEAQGKQAAHRVLFDHAVTHATTILDQHVRPDGSTYHAVNHNDGTGGTPADGSILVKRTLQGFGDETTWSRGQAWGLYGFTMTYRYTRDDSTTNAGVFLDTAMSLADYFISHLPANYTADPHNHLPGDYVPPSDFDAAMGEPVGPWNDADNNGSTGDARPATGEFTLRDSSAAAIAAAALLELSEFAPTEADRQRYRAAAEAILGSLVTYDDPDSRLNYLAVNSTNDGILNMGSRFYDGPYLSQIYGDYYFLEAMARFDAIDLPEPTSLAVLAVGGLWMVRWRTRRRVM